MPESALVKVGVLRFGLLREQMASQLEHIVGVAGFLGKIGELRSQNGRRHAEVFADAVAPGDVAAVQGHLLPEKQRGVAIVRIASKLELARGADEFGDLRVGMRSAEGVAQVKYLTNRV